MPSIVPDTSLEVGYLRVPLKSMCSMKCETPLSLGFSKRDPTARKRPMVTDRISGMGDVMTLSPLSRTSFWYVVRLGMR